MQNKNKKISGSAKKQTDKKTKTTKSANANKKDVVIQTQGDVALQSKSFFKTVVTSVAFWTFLLIVALLLVGANFFGKTYTPDQATSSMQVQQNIRYGSKGKIVLETDKPVAFGEGEVVWTVDGVQAKKGSARQKGSFVLDHSFDSVGTHKVRAEVVGYPNLTCETNVQVHRPLLVIEVQEESKTYGQDNPVPQYSISGFVDNDTSQTLKLATPQFDATKESPVGEYGIKPITHEKYDVVAKGGKLVVNKKTVGLVAKDGTKIYDGNTEVYDLQFDVTGLVGDDEVFVDVQCANYIDKNVGKNKSVKITKATLRGKHAKNYCLAKEPVASGQIVAKNLSLQKIQASDKYFDGGTAVTFDSLGHFEGVATGDDVGIGQIIARFENPSAGKQKRVVVDDVLLVGKDAKNYVVDLPQNIFAEIKGDDTSAVK
ncbi:MAG: hypothetical protein IJV77_07840 [Clostridia bacterium]|nr:hypothetical protein [Clostridia bacterium]